MSECMFPSCGIPNRDVRLSVSVCRRQPVLDWLCHGDFLLWLTCPLHSATKIHIPYGQAGLVAFHILVLVIIYFTYSFPHWELAVPWALGGLYGEDSICVLEAHFHIFPQFGGVTWICIQFSKSPNLWYFRPALWDKTKAFVKVSSSPWGLDTGTGPRLPQQSC